MNTEFRISEASALSSDYFIVPIAKIDLFKFEE